MWWDLIEDMSKIYSRAASAGTAGDKFPKGNQEIFVLTASSTLFLVSKFKRSNLHPIDRHVHRSVILQVESESTDELVDCNWASKMFQLPTRRMTFGRTCRCYTDRRPFEAQPCFYTRRPRLHDGCSDRLGRLSIYITHARMFSRA